MGRYAAEEEKNRNGERMTQFCLDNQLYIGNIFFPHKKCHQMTFVAEGRGVKSAIDYFTYTENMRYAVQDVRVFRSAELNTDHYLLVMAIHFRIPVKQKPRKYTRINNRSIKGQGKEKDIRRRIRSTTYEG